MSNQRFSDRDIRDIERVFRRQASHYGESHTLTHSEQLLLTHFYETISERSRNNLTHMRK